MRFEIQLIFWIGAEHAHRNGVLAIVRIQELLFVCHADLGLD
jgi:hypothetical protein